MMKQISKRILAVLMSLLMATAFVSVAFAAKAVTPVIVVSGMGSFPLYNGEMTNENIVWSPQAKPILKAVGKSMLPLFKALLKRDMNVFADEAFAAVHEELFEIVACDENGDPLYEITAPVFAQSVDHYPDEILNSGETEDEIGILRSMADAVGAENVYFFNYDWRLNPTDHVEALHTFIENVKAEKHADKVTLIPCSMGGTIVNAYLRAYGSSGIDRIVYCLVASKGLDLVGELFNGNISVKTSVLTERLFNFENGKVLSQFLLGALKTVTEVTPLLEKGVDAVVKKLLSSLSDRAYSDIFARSLATMPGLWAFCPDAYYAGAKQTMFPNGGSKVFLDRIDDYHYGVQTQAEALMQRAIDSGTKIYITASYGLVGFPATPVAYTQSDCLIETHNESFGATVADYGATLGSGYTAKGTVCPDPTHRHLSTDGIVDASTCAFPEQTWFIKHMKHVGFPYGSGAADLLVWLVTSEETVDIHSNETYPQFTDLNVITGKLTRLTGDTVTPDRMDQISGVYTRLMKFLRDLYDTVSTYVSKLKK